MVSTLFGILGLAALFALVGLLPLSHRECDSCSGDCTSCPLEDDHE